jgi:hypothetical protein
MSKEYIWMFNTLANTQSLEFVLFLQNIRLIFKNANEKK